MKVISNGTRALGWAGVWAGDGGWQAKEADGEQKRVKIVAVGCSGGGDGS